MANTKLDARQSVLRAATSMIGSAANDSLDTIFPKIDAEIAKLFEDRNILLTDGGTVTFTGTQVQFGEVVNLILTQKISGAVPQIISLGSTSQNFASSGDMWVAVIDRTAGTATTSIVTSGSALPAVSSVNQEVFILAIRKDALDGTQRLYFRDGAAFNAGQSARLGSAGSGGSGSGTGDDLDALQYNASFTDTFSDLPSSSLSSVDVTTGHTNSTYSSTNKYYTLSYDASKTVTGTGTAMTLSGTPAFTVAVGDILRVGTQARRITVVTSQTVYTIESAFTTDPATAAATVSQAVYTKDINNFAADGIAISAQYTDSVSDVLVTYNDTTSGTLYNGTDPANVAYVVSADNTANFSSVAVRESALSLTNGITSTPTSGTNVFLRFFSNKLTGTGTVNLVGYKVFLHRTTAVESGGIQNQAYCTTNASTTAINCTNPTVVGGKTQIVLNFSYPVAVSSGTANGSLQVYVNGQKLPRFVSSAQTPSGSYTEINANTIQLDTDYSGVGFEVEVYQWLSVVDSNTQNTTNISTIQSSLLKNYLINGNFDFWQRSTSATAANGSSTYVADRWYVKNSLGTSGVITFSQNAPGLTNSKFGAKVQITTAPTAAQTNGCELYQTLENSDTLDFLNNSGSFSINVKALGNVTSVGLQLFSATTETKVTTALGTEKTITVNTSTFNLGQLIGQFVGTTPTTSGVIGVRIRILGVSTGNTYDLNNGFIVEQAELNIGGTCIPFRRAGSNIAQEFAMCLRYIETIEIAGLNSSGNLVGSATSTTNLECTVSFKVDKRAAPSMSISSTTPTVVGAGSSIAGTAVTFAVLSTKSSRLSVTVASGLTANQLYSIHAPGIVTTVTADSEI